MEDVGLADLDLVEVERAHRSSRIVAPGDDGGRAVGVEAGDSRGARRAGGRRAGRAMRSQAPRSSRWPCTRSGVVGVELEVDRGERGGGAGDGDAVLDLSRTSAGTSPASDRWPPSSASAASSAGWWAGRCAGGARCGAPSPCGWTRGSRGRRPARPTTYSVLPPPMSITSVGVVGCAPGGRAEEGEPRLLVAGDRRARRCRSARAELVAERPGRSRRRAWRWWRRRRRCSAPRRSMQLAVAGERLDARARWPRPRAGRWRRRPRRAA